MSASKPTELLQSSTKPQLPRNVPRSRHLPTAVTDGSLPENVNKTGVRLWTGCSLEKPVVEQRVSRLVFDAGPRITASPPMKYSDAAMFREEGKASPRNEPRTPELGCFVRHVARARNPRVEFRPRNDDVRRSTRHNHAYGRPC